MPFDLDLTQLHCYGCANSASGEPFPGKPSGERPCCFCVRNKDREAWIERIKEENGGYVPQQHPVNGFWYDGSKAVRVPMDCYRSLDMMDQMEKWMKEDREKV